jgi:two-component system, NarL family, nitrate/nitrite response regulator NarL
MMRLLLADDHPMIRAALEVLLRDTDFEIVGMAGGVQAALEQVGRLEPDILLLDIQMPDGSGLDVLRRIRATKLPIRVVLLTAMIDGPTLLEAKALKVEGIVLKNSDPAFLIECLDSVGAGRNWYDPELTERLNRLASSSSGGGGVSLAPREMQLIGFVRKGMRNREIAEQLGVTEGTVKVYLHAIFEKLDLSNRTELAIRADQILSKAVLKDG